MWTDTDISMFKQSLAETIAWCAPRASLADPVFCLRASALWPAIRHKDFYDERVLYVDDAWKGYLETLSIEKTATAVDTLITERGRLLQSENKPSSVITGDLAGGRLLLSAPDYGFFDGASKAESRGFIDDGDTSPWDTWVSFVFDPTMGQQFYDSGIVSWVPPQFIEEVNKGIRVSFVDNNVWAADIDSAFTHRLAEAHLLR